MGLEILAVEMTDVTDVLEEREEVSELRFGGFGMEFGEWFSVKDVARMLGITEERLRTLIRSGSLRAYKLSGWKIRPEDLWTFLNSRRSNHSSHPSNGEGGQNA